MTGKQAQNLFDSMKDMMDELRSKGFPGMIPAVIGAQTVRPDSTTILAPAGEILSYNDLQLAIMDTTSSDELHAAWKKVLANKELAQWQIRYLTRLKDEQRTKFDF